MTKEIRLQHPLLDTEALCAVIETMPTEEEFTEVVRRAVEKWEQSQVTVEKAVAAALRLWELHAATLPTVAQADVTLLPTSAMLEARLRRIEEDLYGSADDVDPLDLN